MTETDARAFLQNLTVLAEVFDAKFSEAKQMLYFEALRDIPLDRVLAALSHAAKTCRFMPRPVELRDLAVGSSDDHAEVAWSKLLGEVRRVGAYGTPKLPDECSDVMVRLWGTWGHLCQTLPSEGPELLGWAKRFKSLYTSANPVAKALPTPSLFPELPSGDR